MAHIKVKQRDFADCGAACLASVAAHYKRRLPVARVRQYASTDKKGTTVLGLIEAAEQIGLVARAVKGAAEHIRQVPLPAIAHVVTERAVQHYVVIYKITRRYVRVMDPADGRMHNLPMDTFEKQWTGVLLLLSPGDAFQQGNEKNSSFSRFVQLLLPHKAVLLQVLLGALVYTLLGLATSIYLQKIIDQVLPTGNRNLLNLMGTVMVVLLVAQVFINHSKSLLTLRTGQQIDAKLILGYYRHLLRLPQRFFDTMRTGEIIARVNDAVKIRLFINDVLVSLAVNVFVVLLSFSLMFTYYWKLAVVMLMIVPLYAGIYYISNRVNRKTQRKLMERSAELESQLVESVSMIGTIKRFALEEHAGRTTENRFVGLLRVLYRSGVNNLWFGNSGFFISNGFTILLLWVGAGFVMDTQITPGELLSFYAIIGYFTGPVNGLIGMNKTIQDALIAADRLFEIIDLEQEHARAAGKADLTPEMVGDITFRGVGFRYGAGPAIFENLDLTMGKGQVTAIVGESGSGKSSLMSLVQAIYPIQSGSITIGTMDIRHFSAESLRWVIGVVPQRVDLFAGSVVENIAIGDPRPDLYRVASLCTTIGLGEFIDSLPQGLHTPVGENGATLSGGQRQRLAIARALYRDPALLILDEATSALDSASEQSMLQVIQELRQKGKTIFVIAHRLSTVVNADKIVVLHAGKVVEEGTHQSLLASKGYYFDMWAKQMPNVTIETADQHEVT